MSVNWSLYLSHYQKQYGGLYFGDGQQECNAQLIRIEGEKTPLSVCFHVTPNGKYRMNSLRGSTMVRLEKDYHLHIREKTLLGKGVSKAMELAGKGDYGYPEVTSGRFITTDNRDFTKQVFGDLEFRNALLDHPHEYVKVTPGPQEDGWHHIEVGVTSLDGSVNGSEWVTEVMTRDLMFYEKKDRGLVEETAQKHFNTQMDRFLTLLRAAQRAVTAWRIS